MRQIKEVLRLRYALNLSQQAIGHATGISRSTVKDYLARATLANITWPLPKGVTNEALNTQLFPASDNKKLQREQPDWPCLHQSLSKPGMTLFLLWEEYKQSHPEGYQYSWFAQQYRNWSKTQDVWMHQTHQAGEHTFIDYSGLTFPIYTTHLQEVAYHAEVFVSVLGGSNLIFATLTKTQQLPDWISSHNKMFQYYGGVSTLLVPDNLKSGVTKAHRYEPLCNRTYEECAQHYGCAIMPARARKPQDKAKVEKAVQLVQQRIIAKLRNERFSSLKQADARVRVLLEALNNRYSRAYGCSRRELFERMEQAQLQPLPPCQYDIATWRQETVNGGYHICADGHHYSVPYQYVRKKVDIRLTQDCIEIFYQDDRIACHQRHMGSGYTTLDMHRPEAHRQQSLWHYKRLQAWARSIGPNTQQLLCNLFADPKRHLYQKERSALGILRLSHGYSEFLLEQACAKALSIGTWRYDSIASLLKQNRLHHSTQNTCQTPEHDNVRGAQYYH